MARWLTYHTKEEYRVYMIGFLPGFAYMGKGRMRKLLFTQKDKFQDLTLIAGSVGLAGFQTGIYPSEAPVAGKLSDKPL